MAHGDDAMYFSKMNLKGQQLVVTENDKKIVDIYQKLITNFARYALQYPKYASCQPDCIIWARILVSFFSQTLKTTSPYNICIDKRKKNVTWLCVYPNLIH